MTNENSRLRLGIIIGSTRTGRFAPTIANWFAGQAEQHADLTIDLIDLAEFRLSDALSDELRPGLQVLSERLALADAFVVITPEYNHSFPAPLKSAIDWHKREWQTKPVGFVSYGGRSGGLRAVEQLRQIFAELHAMTVRDTVSFHDVWSQFDSDGQPKDPSASQAAAKSMLNQISWWGRAIQDAKLRRPYGV